MTAPKDKKCLQKRCSKNGVPKTVFHFFFGGKKSIWEKQILGNIDFGKQSDFWAIVFFAIGFLQLQKKSRLFFLRSDFLATQDVASCFFCKAQDFAIVFCKPKISQSDFFCNQTFLQSDVLAAQDFAVGYFCNRIFLLLDFLAI